MLRLAALIIRPNCRRIAQHRLHAVLPTIRELRRQERAGLEELVSSKHNGEMRAVCMCVPGGA